MTIEAQAQLRALGLAEEVPTTLRRFPCTRNADRFNALSELVKTVDESHNYLFYLGGTTGDIYVFSAPRDEYKSFFDEADQTAESFEEPVYEILIIKEGYYWLYGYENEKFFINDDDLVVTLERAYAAHEKNAKAKLLRKVAVDDTLVIARCRTYEVRRARVTTINDGSNNLIVAGEVTFNRYGQSVSDADIVPDEKEVIVGIEKANAATAEK